MAQTDQDDGEEEVIYEEAEKEEHHIIETGDSVKVKQVLDDATVEAVTGAGYVINYQSENLKLLLMFLSCVSAMVAQFYPIPFPQSRPLLGICCAIYFILSTILQYIVSFVDKDTIIITKPDKTTGAKLRIRTSFPRFQEWFSLIVQEEDNNSTANVFKSGENLNMTIGKLYVGRYFTEKGEFDQSAYARDVLSHIKKFEAKQYKEFTYDHKSD